MKTASKFLGIAGGAVGLVGSFMAFQKLASLSGGQSMAAGSFSTLILVVGILCTSGSVLGIAGGLMVNKHSFVSAAMMTAGGVLNYYSDLNVPVLILLVAGAIFAAIREDKGRPMKTAAAVLGIAGGSTAILYSAYNFASSAINEFITGGPPSVYSGRIPLFIAICGVIAVAGGALAVKRRVLSGVLMVIASVGVFGIISFIPLLLGGIFALTPEKESKLLSEELS